jgi:hypothetical protein
MMNYKQSQIFNNSTAMGTILSDGGATFNNHTVSTCHTTTRGTSSLGNTPPGDLRQVNHHRERTASSSSTATTASSTNHVETPIRNNISVIEEEKKVRKTLVVLFSVKAFRSCQIFNSQIVDFKY